MVGYDYPILGFFWSMLFIFLWVAWIFLLFRIIADIFRNHDMGGFAKALWLIFVVVLPFLGVLIYVIAYSGDMAERDLKSITFYVAQGSSPEIAARFGNSLIDRALTLETLPMRGRVVPEIGDPNVREIIFKSYRIVYRIRGEAVEIPGRHCPTRFLRRAPRRAHP
jgi:plasmid stabilization system protein ParE